MTIDEFKYNYINNNLNGIWANERVIKNKYENIYILINEFTVDNDITFREKTYRFVYNIKDVKLCLKCNKKLQFIDRKKGYRKACSVSCASSIFHNNAKNTMLNKYGISHPSQIQHNVDKRILKQNKKIQENIGNAILVSNNNNLLKIKCDKCNNIHEINYLVYRQRVQLDLDWRCCVTGYLNGTSNGENEIYEYIKSIYNGKVILNDRKVLNRKELDIYIPEYNIGIEYNGIYFHSELFKDINYHHDKWQLGYDKGINIIQIYEDEWQYKKDIIKSRLSNLLNKSKNKIYARKCEIKKISYDIIKIFLHDNHLQGSIKSNINYGLYYNNELVSVMSFGKPRKSIKYKSNNTNIYELYRFCTKLDTVIVGGANKLFKKFINDYNPDEVYSYSALEWPGKVYEKIGMTLMNISKYSYWFINKKNRISRHTYNKQNLVKMGYDKNKSANDILKDLKIYKIYGPGNKRYVWLKNKI